MALCLEPAFAAKEAERKRAPGKFSRTSGRLKGRKPAVGAKPRTDGERRRSKLTLTSALAGDEARGRSLSSMRRRQEKFKRAMHQEPREKISREVTLPETITVQELANRMSERAVEVVKFMMKQGQMRSQAMSSTHTAELIASEFGHGRGFPNRHRTRPLTLRQSRTCCPGCRRHHHGPCRSRQDLRFDAICERGCGRGWRITQHIGAHQVEKNGQKITHRYARTRGVYRHAGARRAGHRHCDSRGGGR